MFETAQDRPLAVQTPLGTDAVLLTGFRGSTGLSELYRFELDLLMPRPGVPSFEKLLGQAATVRVRAVDGRHHFFHGLVSRVERVARTRTHVHYQAHLVPRFWLLTKHIQSRVFQNQTVPDILRDVLAPLRPDVEIRLRRDADHEPRDYCVQYRESDFAFVSRLMEEEGLFYYFEHSDSGHTLIVVDSHQMLPASDEEIEFDEHPEGSRKSARVFDLRKAQEVSTGAFTFWDQCFELTNQAGPGFQTLEARAHVADTVSVGAVEHTLNLGVSQALEDYQYPGGYARQFDGVGPQGDARPDELPKVYDAGRRRAARRAEEEAAQAVRVAGASACPALTPGLRFRLANAAEDSGDYYVTRVEHAARMPADRSEEEDEERGYRYDNRFECLPAALPYRAPARTPRPLIHGVQTATVVGPEAGENGTAPHVDKYGRVKVQFHWDRRRRFDGHSSCWVRVSQPWAGARWGAFFWPRPGHEVVVAFEHGDPDCPLVTGSVYNAANLPPLELPTGRFDAGFTSCTPGGDPHTEFNCVVFHDRPGAECLHVHSNIHETYTTGATRTTDTMGPVVQTYGRLSMPVPGSGGGGGSTPGKEKQPAPATKYDAPGIYNLLMGVFNRKVGDKEAKAVSGLSDWKSAVKKLLLGELIGPWLGAAFPSKTEYSCGDRFEVSLLGKTTEHQIWGDLQEYKLAHPVDLAESALKDFLPWSDKLKDYYKYAMMGLKLGPEPSGNFELLIGKHTRFMYYGPFIEVERGKKYDYHGPLLKPFSDLASGDLVSVALFALTMTIYASMSAADILGRKYNKLNDHGEVTVPGWFFVNVNFLATKLSGILYELEIKNAETHHAEDHEKQGKQKAKLGKLWALRKANAQAREDLEAAKVSLNELAETLGDVTGVKDPRAVDSTRHAHKYQDRYSLTARNVTLVATTPNGQKDLGDVDITAQGNDDRGGRITLRGGNNDGGSVCLQIAGSYMKLTKSSGTGNSIEILNPSEGQKGRIRIQQGWEAEAPTITLNEKGKDRSLTLECGNMIRGGGEDQADRRGHRPELRPGGDRGEALPEQGRRLDFGGSDFQGQGGGR